MSTIATSSIEEIAKAAPNGINWFQLCIFKDRYILLSVNNKEVILLTGLYYLNT